MNFVCICYGTKYEPVYVQKLYNMVQRHLNVPHKFIVYTDHVKMQKLVTGDIEVRQFPRHDLDGWWNKMQMYSKDSGLEGPCLYMDLDVVILDNIDKMAKFGDDMTFGVINDFNPSSGMYNSSIVKFNTDLTHDLIWTPFINDKTNYQRHQGDQNVMSMLIKNNEHVRVMPDEWTFSFKWYSRKEPRFAKSEWNFDQMPGAMVSVFHGNPNPSESQVEWVIQHWK